MTDMCATMESSLLFTQLEEQGASRTRKLHQPNSKKEQEGSLAKVLILLAGQASMFVYKAYVDG